MLPHLFPLARRPILSDGLIVAQVGFTATRASRKTQTRLVLKGRDFSPAISAPFSGFGFSRRGNLH